jgi:hypothetical protein
VIVPDQQDNSPVRVADMPNALELERAETGDVRAPVPRVGVRRARFAFSRGPDSVRACSDQVREVMDLVLPELSPADSLVDWASVTAGEFVAHLLHAVEAKITCELRVDGEHLYVSVEAFDRCGGACSAPGAGRRFVDAISVDAGSYATDSGKRVMWAAADIIPVGVSAA